MVANMSTLRQITSATRRSALSEAELLLRRNLRLALQKHGGEHTAVGHAHIQLGDFLTEEHRFSEAESFYRHAITIYEALGIGHELLQVIAMRSLADAICRQGRVKEARSIRVQALNIVSDYQ